MAQNEKQCLVCKRSLSGKGKYGVCPDCINKYGTPIAALTSVGIVFVGKKLLKGGGKVVKAAWNMYRNIKG
ncbi:MAG: hypothetical protein E7329_04610 [Clostridiales bacterium]|nr:hypothetical protein [Clostridiales bacterium]